MKRTLILPLVLWMAWSFLPAASRLPSSPLEFELHRNYLILVPGRIGPLSDLHFVIATGAVPTVISPRVARKLQVELHSATLPVFGKTLPVQEALLPELTLGPLQVRHLLVVVQDLSVIERALGRPVDAVVGLDDAERRRLHRGLRVPPPRLPDPPPLEHTAPFETALFVVVQAELESRPARLLLDTGTRDLVLYRNRWQGPLEGLKAQGQKDVFHLAGTTPLFQVRIPRLLLGSLSRQKADVFLMDIPDDYLPFADGVVGPVALGMKRLHFDCSRNLLSWETH